jgi:hypothetical protein
MAEDGNNLQSRLPGRPPMREADIVDMLHSALQTAGGGHAEVHQGLVP